GLGSVGEAVDRRARGFGMRILYTKRHRLDESREAALSVEYRSLNDLLQESDFVSINAALSPETIHLIGDRELSLMRPSAYLENIVAVIEGRRPPNLFNPEIYEKG